MPDRNAQGQAAKGNRLAMLHGLYSCLAIGSLPKGAGGIRRCLGRFRMLLAEVVRAKSVGRPPKEALRKEALAASAVEHERLRRLAMWYVARKGESLTADQFTNFLATASRETDARDRNVAALCGDDAGHDLASLLGLGSPGSAQDASDGDGRPFRQEKAQDAAETILGEGNVDHPPQPGEAAGK